MAVAGDSGTPKDARRETATSRVVVHPSSIVRPVPGFVFAIPKGWVVDEAAFALAMVRPVAEIDGFFANLLITHDRVPRAVDFERAAKLTWERIARDTPDAKVVAQQLVRFGDNIVHLRGAEMSAPQTGRAIAQWHALFFAPVDGGGKTVDFFQITATAATETMDRIGATFVDIIASFRFV